MSPLNSRIFFIIPHFLNSLKLLGNSWTNTYPKTLVLDIKSRLCAVRCNAVNVRCNTVNCQNMITQIKLVLQYSELPKYDHQDCRSIYQVKHVPKNIRITFLFEMFYEQKYHTLKNNISLYLFWNSRCSSCFYLWAVFSHFFCTEISCNRNSSMMFSWLT